MQYAKFMVMVSYLFAIFISFTKIEQPDNVLKVILVVKNAICQIPATLADHHHHHHHHHHHLFTHYVLIYNSVMNKVIRGSYKKKIGILKIHGIHKKKNRYMYSLGQQWVLQLTQHFFLQSMYFANS